MKAQVMALAVNPDIDHRGMHFIEIVQQKLRRSLHR